MRGVREAGHRVPDRRVAALGKLEGHADAAGGRGVGPVNDGGVHRAGFRLRQGGAHVGARDQAVAQPLPQSHVAERLLRVLPCGHVRRVADRDPPHRRRVQVRRGAHRERRARGHDADQAVRQQILPVLGPDAAGGLEFVHLGGRRGDEQVRARAGLDLGAEDSGGGEVELHRAAVRLLERVADFRQDVREARGGEDGDRLRGNRRLRAGRPERGGDQRRENGGHDGETPLHGYPPTATMGRRLRKSGRRALVRHHPPDGRRHPLVLTGAEKSPDGDAAPARQAADDLAGAGQAQARAADAERLGLGRDEADDPAPAAAVFGHEIAAAAAGLAGERRQCECAFKATPDFRGGDEAVGGQGARAADRHEFEKPHRASALHGERRQAFDLAVIPAAQDHGVQLHGRQASRLRPSDAAERPPERAAAGQRCVRFLVETRQADIDPAQAGAPKGGRLAGQGLPVGREGQVRNSLAREHPHQADHVRADERLAAGDVDFGEVEPRLRDADEVKNFLKRQDFLVRQFGHAFGRHAMDAAELAAVRDRDAQGERLPLRRGHGSDLHGRNSTPSPAPRAVTCAGTAITPSARPPAARSAELRESTGSRRGPPSSQKRRASDEADAAAL